MEHQDDAATLSDSEPDDNDDPMPQLLLQSSTTTTTATLPIPVPSNSQGTQQDTSNTPSAASTSTTSIPIGPSPFFPHGTQPPPPPPQQQPQPLSPPVQNYTASRPNVLVGPAPSTSAPMTAGGALPPPFPHPHQIPGFPTHPGAPYLSANVPTFSLSRIQALGDYQFDLFHHHQSQTPFQEYLHNPVTYTPPRGTSLSEDRHSFGDLMSDIPSGSSPEFPPPTSFPAQHHPTSSTPLQAPSTTSPMVPQPNTSIPFASSPFVTATAASDMYAPTGATTPSTANAASSTPFMHDIESAQNVHPMHMLEQHPQTQVTEPVLAGPLLPTLGFYDPVQSTALHSPSPPPEHHPLTSFIPGTSSTGSSGAGPSSAGAAPTLGDGARLAAEVGLATGQELALASEMLTAYLAVITAHETTDSKMSGLIKDALPVRGLKMARIRYELHMWYQCWQSQRGEPPLIVRKTFAFALMHSRYFEDKLAAILFMQEVLLANQHLGAQDLNIIEGVFQRDDVAVYKVCDHFAEKVLFLIVKNHNQDLDRMFDWTNAQDKWQARAGLTTLQYFVEAAPELHVRMLDAALSIMRRPQEEAKSAAGSMLRELSKQMKDTVVQALKEPDIIAYTSVHALKKACSQLDPATEAMLKELRKDVLAQRRTRST